MSSLSYFTKAIDFRLYIGHAVAFVCLAAYGVIFYFIWKDGEWSREMTRREKQHKQNQAAKNLDRLDSGSQYREKEEAFSDEEPASVEATSKPPVKKAKKTKKKSKRD